MKLEVFIRKHQELCNEKEDMMVKKNHDYSKDTDMFHNFEAVAKTLNCSVDIVFQVELAMKIVRIGQLRDKEARHESLADSLIDLANYTDLYIIWKRSQGEEGKQ